MLEALALWRGPGLAELGIDPGPVLQRLEQAILVQDPSLDVARRPPSAGDSRADRSAPADGGAELFVDRPGPPASRPLSSFVGREQVVAEVKRLVAGASLVTLTGPGGAGKTRLAAQVGWEAASQFPDGVCLVELAPVGAPDLVPQTLARLGLRGMECDDMIPA